MLGLMQDNSHSWSPNSPLEAIHHVAATYLTLYLDFHSLPIVHIKVFTCLHLITGCLKSY